jgi:hypothetical protein
MPSMSALLDRLKAEYDSYTFIAGDSFAWNPTDHTITYDSDDPLFEARLLHELAHALLEHSEYVRDIDLIAMERDAWQKAKMELGHRYEVQINGDVVHHDMDTYRDWLHARSTCPHCGSNGIQVKHSIYRCVTCLKEWKVNEARMCQLRRYRLN